MKAKELNRRIEKLGGQLLRKRGSHWLYQVVGEDGEKLLTVVSQHSGDIPPGTLAAIDRQLAPAFGKGWTK